ncbi:MAG: Gfo/Idh/MocA family oxidoreductase [Thermomicrobiales bacterium]
MAGAHEEHMERVGVGVIGCGIGKWHVEGYREEPRADIIALAGLDTPRCNEVAAEANVPNVYEDYHQLLNRQDIAAVSIAVPNFLHVPIGLDAIAAGKHVLMEKPLARHEAEAETLVRAAADAGVVLGIAFNRRARSDMQVLKRHIDGGALGRIYHAAGFQPALRYPLGSAPGSHQRTSAVDPDRSGRPRSGYGSMGHG